MIAAAFAAFHRGGDASATVCPTSPTATLEDFPPYKYELGAGHAAELDTLAKKILGMLGTKSITKIRIVGHAALYGNTDLAKTARYRASVVESELQSRLADLGIDYAKITFDTSGMSTDCPVDTNKTKAGRAKNRRVEVWVVTTAKKTAKKKTKTKPKKTKELTLDKALTDLRSSTSNPTIKCFVDNMLDKHADHSYVSGASLDDYMKKPIAKATGDGFATTEMRDLLIKTVDRINAVELESKTPQQRFDDAFLNHRSSIIAAYTSAIPMDCYDRRVPELRRYFVRQTKDEDSLYSCSVIKKQITRLIDDVGGIKGCGSP